LGTDVLRSLENPAPHFMLRLLGLFAYTLAVHRGDAMNETFTSVLLFHTALKNFLTSSLGWTVDRVLNADDVILTNGAGAFLRIQKKTTGAVVAIGLELGTTADALQISTKDPELCLPFDTSAGGLFQCSALQLPDPSKIELTILASGDRWSKRYRVSLTLNPMDVSVYHQDHLNSGSEPNFKERGGTYVQAGA